jgi:hypothetical protein
MFRTIGRGLHLLTWYPKTIVSRRQSPQQKSSDREVWAGQTCPPDRVGDYVGMLPMGWRERMGIEPTRSLFPDPSPVLKTGPSTSNGNAPRVGSRSQNTTICVGIPFFQGGCVHRFLNSRTCYHVRKRLTPAQNVPRALSLRCQNAVKTRQRQAICAGLLGGLCPRGWSGQVRECVQG